MNGINWEEVRNIIGDINCPRKFRCVEPESNNLCGAMDIGMETYLQCLDRNPMDCSFSIAFADTFFCRCPLRIYLKKNINK